MSIAFDLDGGGVVPGASPDSGVGDVFGAVSLGDGGTDDGSGGGDDFTFDSERHISRDKRNADGSYRRKRKRRGSNVGSSGGQRTKTRSDYSSSLDALTNTLIIVHAGLASVSKIKELEIDETEGKTLATAVANVLAEFDIEPDPKVQAIVGLVVAAGSIYGPRMYLYKERVKAETKAKKAASANPLHIVG